MQLVGMTQVVTIPSSLVRRQISRASRFKSDKWGRTLVKDVIFGDVNLPAGFRLDPTRCLPDVARFDSMPTPFEATFWDCRQPKQLRLLHESPVFLIPGASFALWCIDILHTWHLGPCAAYIAFVIWFIICSKVIEGVAFLDLEDGYRACINEIKGHLWTYYAAKRKDDDFKKRGSMVLGVHLIALVAFVC